MKKLSSSRKFKKRLIRLAILQEKRRSRLKHFQMQRSRRFGISRHTPLLKSLPAPERFDLISNPNEVLAYFNHASLLVDRKVPVEFDLRQITRLSPDSIALLIAKIRDENFNRGVRLSGTCPDNLELGHMFRKSGFYKYVNSNYKDDGASGHALLNRVTSLRVENETAREVCKEAIAYTFGDGRIYRPLYEVIIECMANTYNHATANGEKAKYNWWLFRYSLPESKTTHFCFIDLGVGIFESLPFKNFIAKVALKVGLRQNVSYVNDLFTGQIRSRTGLPERGRGIPLIYNYAKSGKIRNLILISNDVYANVETEQYMHLLASLKGTILSFDLCED